MGLNFYAGGFHGLIVGLQPVLGKFVAERPVDETDPLSACGKEIIHRALGRSEIVDSNGRGKFVLGVLATLYYRDDFGDPG